MSLVSVETLKEYLSEYANTTAADTELQNLLDRVEAVVADFLGFPKPASSVTTATLSATNYVLYFDRPSASDPLMLQLNVKPINSLTSVYVDVNREYKTSDALNLSNIDVDAVNARLIIRPKSSDNFERGFRAIKVTCNAGYSEAPDDLQHAICVLASQIQRAKQNQGKDQLSQQGVSVKLSKRSIPDEVKQILFPFRNPRSII